MAAGTLWAYVVATGFVAATAFAVRIVIVRVVFDIPVLATALMHLLLPVRGLTHQPGGGDDVYGATSEG